jgi:hypothetical protein
VHFYSGPSGRVYAQLVGEGQSDPLVQKELRDHLVAPRREALRAIWDRGVARGELRADVDPGPLSIWCSRHFSTDSSWATTRSTKRRRARLSTSRCADSLLVTDITQPFGTEGDRRAVVLNRNWTFSFSDI